MEIQLCEPPVSAHGEQEGLNKEIVNSPSTSVWEKDATSALTMKPDNPVPPGMSLVLLGQLPPQ